MKRKQFLIELVEAAFGPNCKVVGYRGTPWCGLTLMHSHPGIDGTVWKQDGSVVVFVDRDANGGGILRFKYFLGRTRIELQERTEQVLNAIQGYLKERNIAFDVQTYNSDSQWVRGLAIRLATRNSYPWDML